MNRADLLRSTLVRILRPLVRVLLRNGFSFEAFADLSRKVYVEVARDHFPLERRKQTASRIAVITGLTRKEVAALLSDDDAAPGDSMATFNRAAKVLTAWLREYPDGAELSGARQLPIDGATNSFSALAKRHAGDVPFRAVLDELIHAGAVKRLDSVTVAVVGAGHVLTKQGDSDANLAMLGDNAADLISAISHNLDCAPDDTFYERKVWFDNIPVEALPYIRAHARERSLAFTEEMRQLMARFDRDVSPGSVGTGRARSALGIYFLEEVTEKPESAKPIAPSIRRKQSSQAPE